MLYSNPNYTVNTVVSNGDENKNSAFFKSCDCVFVENNGIICDVGYLSSV